MPDEWNVRDPYIAAADSTRVVDFRRSSLHVVSYSDSEPVRKVMPLEGLRERLHAPLPGEHAVGGAHAVADPEYDDKLEEDEIF